MDYVFRDRVEEPELVQVNRFDFTPEPITWIVREKVFSDGTVVFVKRTGFSGMGLNIGN